eukprot:scaffold175063_cov27-Tisochrysis_lutea.AAC.2
MKQCRHRTLMLGRLHAVLRGQAQGRVRGSGVRPRTAYLLKLFLSLFALRRGDCREEIADACESVGPGVAMEETKGAAHEGEGRVRQRIADGWRDRGADKCVHVEIPGWQVLHHGLRNAKRSQSLDARKLSEARHLDAAHRDSLANRTHVRRRAEDIRAERKIAVVRNPDELVVVIKGDDRNDGPEHLVAQQARLQEGRVERGRDEHDGRREELAIHAGRPMAPGEDTGACRLCLCDYGLEALHFSRHAHGPDVDAGVSGRVERRPLTHRLGCGSHLRHKLVQQGGVHQVALTAHAVLAGSAKARTKRSLQRQGGVGAW